MTPEPSPSRSCITLKFDMAIEDWDFIAKFAEYIVPAPHIAAG